MISPRNSTQSNIADGGAFVGGVDPVEEYAGVSISIYSDVDLDLFVEQSLNGKTWEYSESGSYVAASEMSTTYNLRYRYYRLRIENNSGADSTELRACSKFHKGLPMEEPLEVTGALTMEKYSPELSLASGGITGESSMSIWGVGSVSPSGFGVVTSLETPAVVWSPLTTPVALEVVSASTFDVSPSTGAWEVRVKGISGAGASQEELIATNGTTAVAVPGTWLCVNSLEVTSCGTALSNEGNIDVRVSGGGTVHARIQASHGKASQCIYRAPITRRVFLRNFEYSAQDHGVVYDIRIWAFDPTASIRTLVFATESTDSPSPQNWDLGRRELPLGAEIALEMNSSTGGTIIMSASIGIELVDA